MSEHNNLNNFLYNINATIVADPPKKKKGRKTKQEKLLLEQEKIKNTIPKSLFPSRDQIIFDCVNIDGRDCYYNRELKILFDEESNLIGIEHNNKFTLFEDDDKKINNLLGFI